jgi:Ser-tRNA(Ala) deacylase AlaX
LRVTQRLYLEDPRRKTALAEVIGHAAGGFVLDKTVFHAADARYHHAQPCDLGHVLAEGHKLKLDKVFWDSRGNLVHKTSGPLPAVGAKAQLHLDAPRREQNARAHAAMHLLIAALAEQRATLLEPPRVVGGGETRANVTLREDPRTALPRIVARANELAATREDVTATWTPRDDAAKLVALDDVAPDEPTLRIVRCGTHSTLPCDAPLVTNLRELGPLRLTLTQPGRQGVRFGVKALPP